MKYVWSSAMCVAMIGVFASLVALGVTDARDDDAWFADQDRFAALEATVVSVGETRNRAAMPDPIGLMTASSSPRTEVTLEAFEYPAVTVEVRGRDVAVGDTYEAFVDTVDRVILTSGGQLSGRPAGPAGAPTTWWPAVTLAVSAATLVAAMVAMEYNDRRIRQARIDRGELWITV